MVRPEGPWDWVVVFVFLLVMLALAGWAMVVSIS